MATRKAVNKEEVEVKTTEEVVENKVDTNEAMLKMMQEMQEKMMAMEAELKEAKAEGTKEVVAIQSTVNPNRVIKVMSMLNNTYNLGTKKFGAGKVFTFEKYGEVKSIKFRDMLDVISIYEKQFEQGMAILLNKQDYVDLGLEHIYDDVLTMGQLEDIVELTKHEHIDIILGLSDVMFESVLSIIARKVVDGHSYDFNMIEKLKAETDLVEAIEIERKNKLAKNK